MNFPRVTVMIPNHNDEQYIQKAIDSALNQDYLGPLRVCVVDDGSSDGSWDLINSLFENIDSVERVQDLSTIKGVRKNRSFIAIKRPQAGGPSEARNTGIDFTLNDTDIYAMLDSDDEFYTKKVNTCVDIFVKDSGSVGVVYGDYDTYNTNTGIMIREFKEPFNRRRLVNECIIHSGSVVSKEALVATKEDTGYYDKNMRTCEDYDLWMRISELFMIVHVAEALTMVRVTGANSSFIIDSETWQKNWKRVMEKFHQRNNAY